MPSAGSHWIVSYLLPPLIGAGIGYLTNTIAIRMLFRPFTEKRIFGLKVPFTPGIIPKYRYDLAENIGVLVSEELLSSNMLQAHLKSPEFRESLHARVGILTEELLRKKAGYLLSFLKNNKTNPPRIFSLNNKNLAERPVKSFLPVNPGLMGRELFLLLYPSIFKSILKALLRPDVKARLQDRGREFIEEVQERLNFFQKFMISAGRYDKTLKKKMPEIIDDLLVTIEEIGFEQKNIDLLAESLHGGINSFADKSLADIFEEKPGGLREIFSSGSINLGRSIFMVRHMKLADFIELDHEQKGKLDKWIFETATEQVGKHLDSMLQILDIKKMVVDRINHLSIEDVERILLIIIEKHLAWINIFGAILGGIIGAVQILIRLLG